MKRTLNFNCIYYIGRRECYFALNQQFMLLLEVENLIYSFIYLVLCRTTITNTNIFEQ